MLKRNLTFAFLMLSGTLLFCEIAEAQTGPSAGCFVSPARLPVSEIETFIQAPEQLLVNFLQGGIQLASQVRALAGSSSDTLEPILRLTSQASTEQLAGMGAGLARAARACAASEPEYALQIQERVIELNNAAMTTAFLGASNDVETAALGGAGAGATGAAGIGSGGVAGGGAAGLDGSEATASSSGSYSVSRGSRYFSASLNVLTVSPN